MKKRQDPGLMASWQPLANAVPLSGRILTPEVVVRLLDELVQAANIEDRARRAEQLRALIIRTLERHPAVGAALKRSAKKGALHEELRQMADSIIAEGKTEPRDVTSKAQTRYDNSHPADKPISRSTVARARRKK